MRRVRPGEGRDKEVLKVVYWRRDESQDQTRRRWCAVTMPDDEKRAAHLAALMLDLSFALGGENPDHCFTLERETWSPARYARERFGLIDHADERGDHAWRVAGLEHTGEDMLEYLRRRRRYKPRPRRELDRHERIAEAM